MSKKCSIEYENFKKKVGKSQRDRLVDLDVEKRVTIL
jgi:hypothetical protein